MIGKFLLLLSYLSAVGSSMDPRGVDPDHSSFYDAHKKSFQCLNGDSVIPFSRVNDDYCDCSDGSDEPGTSACPNGSFYCHNKGYVSLSVPSSRVNDGICDCCDGSDEWESRTTPCEDICDKVGAEARAERARRLKVIQEGLVIKETLIAAGEKIKSSKVAEISEKEVVKAEAESKRSLLLGVKEAAEASEKIALDVYREEEERQRLIKEEEDKLKEEQKILEIFQTLDSNSDGNLGIADLKTHLKFDQNNDGIVSDEEAQFFMSGHDSYDFDSFKETGWPLIKATWEGIDPISDPTLVDGKEEVAEEGQKEETLDYDEEYTDEDLDTRPTPPSTTTETQPEETEEGEEEEEEESAAVENPESSKYDPETQRLIEEANKARSDYDAIDRQVRDLEREIQNLHGQIQRDYGKQNEFLPLLKECFEFSDFEYTYKMCAFDYCSQRSKSGGAETRLGDWDSWTSPYVEMKYDKGVQCWNGPQRSTKVKVSCGIESKITAVSEPSKCEYYFEFETPAACFPVPADEEFTHDEL